MTKLTRFGRKIPLPSTRQIRHELAVLGLREEARMKELATTPTAAAVTAVMPVDPAELP